MSVMKQQEQTIDAAAITVNNVVQRYANSRQVTHINHWQVSQGERVFLHGPSGSGKTTLLNLLAGVLLPESGSISLLGQDFSSMSAKKRDRFRAQHIGVVFQQFNLIPHLTVLQNIELAAFFAGNKQDIAATAKQLITELNLPANILGQQASTLSVGQQQRVAIARALINRPEILLVDEPTSALDADARDAFMQVLLTLCESANSTLLFVSHDPALASYFSTQQALTDICLKGEASAC